MSIFKYTREYLAKNHIAIKCDTAEQAWSVYSIYNGKNNWDITHTCFGFDGDDLAFYGEGVVVAYGENIIPASEVITAYEASKQPDRKIVGYVYPFDTIDGEKVTDKLVSLNDDSIYVLKVGHNIYPIVPEIVEHWEPVYEEVRPLINDLNDLLNCSSGWIIEVDRTKIDFTPEFANKIKGLGIKTYGRNIIEEVGLSKDSICNRGGCKGILQEAYHDCGCPEQRVCNHSEPYIHCPECGWISE